MIDPYITKATKLDIRIWSKKLNRFLQGFEEAAQYFFGFANDRKKKDNLSLAFGDGPDSFFIIQRSIGLQDKDGTDIYEGDILGELYDGKWCAKGVVNYDKGEALFYLYLPGEGYIGNFADLENSTKDMLIIGNLFENEELITQDEEEDDRT